MTTDRHKHSDEEIAEVLAAAVVPYTPPVPPAVWPSLLPYGATNEEMLAYFDTIPDSELDWGEPYSSYGACSVCDWYHENCTCHA